MIRTRQPHAIDAQRYDLHRPDGMYQRRYWKLESAPVFDHDDGEINIVQRVEDVTAHRTLVDERTRPAWERGRLATGSQGVRARRGGRASALAVYQHAPLAMALLGGRQHVFEFANAATSS